MDDEAIVEIETPGALIRWAREQAEMSQAELAERIGCHPSLIGHWEKGRYGGVSGENLILVAHACGFDVVLQPMHQEQVARMAAGASISSSGSGSR